MREADVRVLLNHQTLAIRVGLDTVYPESKIEIGNRERPKSPAAMLQTMAMRATGHPRQRKMALENRLVEADT